jgi:hypothetical protein
MNAIVDFDDVLYDFSFKLYTSIFIDLGIDPRFLLKSEELNSRANFYFDNYENLFFSLLSKEEIKEKIENIEENLYVEKDLINRKVLSFIDEFQIYGIRPFILTHTLKFQNEFKYNFIKSFFKEFYLNDFHNVDLSIKKSEYINNNLKETKFSIIIEDNVTNIIDIIENCSYNFSHITKENPLSIIIPRKGWNENRKDELLSYLNNKLPAITTFI